MHNIFSKKPKIEQNTPVQPQVDIYDLDAQEIEIILSLLKESSFKVRDIDFLYRALWKLTEQRKLKLPKNEN